MSWILGALSHDFTLHREATIERVGEEWRFQRGASGLYIQHLPRLLREGAERLQKNGLTQAWMRKALDGQSPGDRLTFCAILQRLDQLRLLAYSIFTAKGPLLTAYPSAGSPVDPLLPDPDADYQISRFTAMHRGDRCLSLTVPLTSFEADVHSPELAALLTRFAIPRSIRLDPAATENSTELRRCLELLIRIGALRKVEVEGGSVEDQVESLLPWESHDLIFHLRTREGFHDHPTGGTFRFVGRLAPEWPTLPPEGEAMTPLPIPSPPAEGKDAELFRLLDERRSIREHGEKPITLAQLAELLYRSARTLRTFETEAGPVSLRPYPSGGGIHELEIYVVANRCEGLKQGVYRYLNNEHGLARHPVDFAKATPLLEDAQFSSQLNRVPDVLLVIAAHFQRLSWKYEGMAYALVLKHVGCLLQTLYLTATALRLAPCAIGNGNARHFGELLGYPPYVKPSVGEFIVGSRAETDPGI